MSYDQEQADIEAHERATNDRINQLRTAAHEFRCLLWAVADDGALSDVRAAELDRLVSKHTCVDR